MKDSTVAFLMASVFIAPHVSFTGAVALAAILNAVAFALMVKESRNA